MNLKNKGVDSNKVSIEIMGIFGMGTLRPKPSWNYQTIVLKHYQLSNYQRNHLQDCFLLVVGGFYQAKASTFILQDI